MFSEDNTAICFRSPQQKGTRMNAPPTFRDAPVSFLKKHTVTIKMAWIGFLVLILLIPLAMIRGVLHERMDRRNSVISEITSSWGTNQVVVGPVLVLPYRYRIKTWTDQTVNGKQERIEVEETHVANAFFLPAELAVDGTVSPEMLHRGIYDAVVYKGHLTLSGRFQPPALDELGIPAGDVMWENARVSVAVSDLRGTGNMLSIMMEDRKCEFVPGCLLYGYSSGINAHVPDVTSETGDLDFTMELDLKGSRGLSFAPLGRQNQVHLASEWPDPSFRGAFLPAERQVTTGGFDAVWEVTWYGRHFPQQSTDRSSDRAFNDKVVEPSLFGVDFLDPVDAYRMVERAIKYGILFIALIFTAFFLFENVSTLRIHTVQYTLVGAAMCLFYLAVLSLSEFIEFGYAYWIGVAVSTVLIILYSTKILKAGSRVAILGAALAGIYSYLYVVLQLQDYSLLLGTAGLFIVLGIVMYTTRNIDWANRE